MDYSEKTFQEAEAATPISGPRTATAAHTPGPWKHRPLCGDLSGASLGFIMFGASDRLGTITVNSNIPECVANARLIAAAPTMLAALQLQQKRCMACNGTGFYVGAHPPPGKPGMACYQCEHLRAAITAAVGDPAHDATPAAVA